MGGQHGYFGLWIDSDYGKGHSKAKPRCTTYNSPQLSAKEDFTLDAVEVWAVGDLPESAGVGEQNWNLWNCVLIGTGDANAKFGSSSFLIKHCLSVVTNNVFFNWPCDAVYFVARKWQNSSGIIEGANKK